MSDRHRVTLVGSHEAPNTAQLLIDGKDISSAVTSLRLDIDTGSEHRLELQLTAFPLAVQLEGVKVRVDDETAEILQWLGWTPPPPEEETADVMD